MSRSARPVVVLLFVLSFGLPSLPASAQLNLLTNASFEEPRVHPTIPAMTVVPPLAGWRTEGRAALVRFTYWEPAERQGRQSLVLGGIEGAASIEQSVPTQVGKFYLISGWLGRDVHDYPLTTTQVKITLNGEPFADVVHNDSGAKQDDMRWKLFAHSFQAKNANTVFRISGAGAVLDGMAVTLTGSSTPAGNYFPIDLTPVMNFRLMDGVNGPGNDLLDLGDTITPETPLRVLGGVPFLLDGLLIVGRDGFVGDTKVPHRINGIPVGRKLSTLHFLHAAQYSQASRGTRIGAYEIHFADGTVLLIPLRYGVDLADWWSYPGITVTEATIAWRGSNEGASHWSRYQNFPSATGRALGIQLYLKTWQNPLPAVEIKSIDLVSADSSSVVPRPFVVAITGL